MVISIIGWFLLGVCIGWLTKIPFLIKWYNDYKRGKEEMKRMSEKIEKIYQEQEKNV